MQRQPVSRQMRSSRFFSRSTTSMTDSPSRAGASYFSLPSNSTNDAELRPGEVDDARRAGRARRRSCTGAQEPAATAPEHVQAIATRRPTRSRPSASRNGEVGGRAMPGHAAMLPADGFELRPGDVALRCNRSLTTARPCSTSVIVGHVESGARWRGDRHAVTSTTSSAGKRRRSAGRRLPRVDQLAVESG